MTPGRPLQYDPTAAVEAAMHAFWRRGYAGTSLQDLLSATGLSKSSFYLAFKSKHEAFQMALAHYRAQLTTRLGQRLAEARSGIDFIEAALLGAADEACAEHDPRGCLIINTAIEFSSRDAILGTLVDDSVKQVSQIFADAIRRAQREGAIAPERDAEILGRYVLSSLSGLRAMVKAGATHAAAREIAQVVLLALR
jgi:TetR/AcrR family transcriptional repressor of nem operon